MVAEVDLFRGLRAGWGMLLIAAPSETLRAVAGTAPHPVARQVARLLGARELAQAFLIKNQRRARIGSAVDGLHAASMMALAVSQPKWRRLAFTSAAIASAFGATTWINASQGREALR